MVQSLFSLSSSQYLRKCRSIDFDQNLEDVSNRSSVFSRNRPVRAPIQCNVINLENSTDPSPSRRTLLRNISLTTLSMALPLIASPPPPSRAAGNTITVGQGDTQTISKALQFAQDGDTILLSPGIYRERVILDKAVTLIASTPAAASSPQSAENLVEIIWETDQPYESTIVCTVDGASLKGPITIKHNSYSIANNYAVQLINCGSGTVLEGCTISSETGSGIGIEGGNPQILNCTIKNCARSGIMVFSDLDGTSGTPKIERCTIENNTQHGVLVREGAEPAVNGNTIQGNGGYGLALQGCAGEYKENVIKNNKKGAVAVHLLFDGLDSATIAKENGLEMKMITDTTLKMM
jgi:parallel beta-helix repeat protein